MESFRLAIVHNYFLNRGVPGLANRNTLRKEACYENRKSDINTIYPQTRINTGFSALYTLLKYSPPYCEIIIAASVGLQFFILIGY